jgi:hypothetical protein
VTGKRECRYVDCHDLVHGRGMCMRHYSRLHRLMRSRGELQRTDVAPVAHHITALRAKGFSWAEIGRRGHLDGETLARICNGRNGTILVSRARRILAVKPEWQLTAVFVPVVGTRRRLEALAWQGWSSKTIAPRIGVSWHKLAKTSTYDRIEARNAAPLAGFYDEYATIAGPDPRWAKTARRRGYLPWGVWDDDTIDDPDAAPDLSALRVDEPRRRIDLDEVAERLSYGQDGRRGRGAGVRRGERQGGAEAAAPRQGSGGGVMRNRAW